MQSIHQLWYATFCNYPDLMSKPAFSIKNEQLVMGVTLGNTNSCVDIRYFPYTVEYD